MGATVYFRSDALGVTRAVTAWMADLGLRPSPTRVASGRTISLVRSATAWIVVRDDDIATALYDEGEALARGGSALLACTAVFFSVPLEELTIQLVHAGVVLDTIGEDLSDFEDRGPTARRGAPAVWATHFEQPDLAATIQSALRSRQPIDPLDITLAIDAPELRFPSLEEDLSWSSALGLLRHIARVETPGSIRFATPDTTLLHFRD